MAQTRDVARPRALVTGASAGIGMAFTRRLARAGHDLIVVARRRDRLEALAQELRRDAGAAVEVIDADLTDTRALAEIEERVSRDEALALLINNAGFGGYKPFVSLETKVIDDLIDIHVRAMARLTRAALPRMVQRGAGSIVNIASVLALSGTLPPDPLPHRVTYAAAKAFMMTFTQALAAELDGTGVRVQVCLPGRVDTEFHLIQGLDTSRLPPMMSAEDIVTGALAGLHLGEVVCVPALGEPALLDRLAEAQLAVFKAAAIQPKPSLADRYRITV